MSKIGRAFISSGNFKISNLTWDQQLEKTGFKVILIQMFYVKIAEINILFIEKIQTSY